MLEKIKTDVDRLLLVSKLKKISTLAKYIGKFVFIIKTKSILSKSAFILCAISEMETTFYVSEVKINSVRFLLSKMHSFQNKMKEQINQSIVHRWLRLFRISQAIFEFHLEKMMRFLRRSTNRSIF